MNIFNVLGFKEDQNNQLGDLFNHIEQLSESIPEEEIKLITGYAGILGKIAYADSILMESELESIKNILIENTHINSRTASDIIDILTRNKEQLLAVEDHFYDRLINEICDKSQKQQLLHSMFLVAAADNNICIREEQALTQVANMLKIPAEDQVTMKRKFTQYLETLK